MDTGKIKKLNIIVLSIMIVLCLSLLFTTQLSMQSVFAESSSYTNVLDDLRKDESFNTSLYPEVSDNYSLNVIQIAESSNKELFIYVYQPSGQAKRLAASSINISLKPRNDIAEGRNYKLTLLNSSGVFFKYRVDGLTVSSADTRYYTVTAIYRPFDKSIDEEAGHGNEVSEVEYAVAKEYCFSIINGEPFSRVLDIETIEITDKFVGFVRYSNGFELWPSSCDSHFVAFNTDRDIDRLFEADVYYTSQTYSQSFIAGVGENETFGDKEDNYAYLTYEQKVEHTGGGWFAPTYEWNRIETVDQFIAENDLSQNVYSGALLDVQVANKITDEGKKALQGKKWVLRFAETDYKIWSGAGASGSNTMLVGDVTILRLKFETDGIVYNLGTIDNKQTGSDTPSNDEQTDIGISDTAKWIFAILALIALLILFGPILPYIVKGIVWVIMLPFKLIKAIINAIKKKDGTGNSPKVTKQSKSYKSFSDKANIHTKASDTNTAKQYKRKGT